jgi:hypothetical protein
MARARGGSNRRATACEPLGPEHVAGQRVPQQPHRALFVFALSFVRVCRLTVAVEVEYSPNRFTIGTEVNVAMAHAQCIEAHGLIGSALVHTPALDERARSVQLRVRPQRFGRKLSRVVAEQHGATTSPLVIDGGRPLCRIATLAGARLGAGAEWEQLRRHEGSLVGSGGDPNVMGCWVSLTGPGLLRHPGAMLSEQWREPARRSKPRSVRTSAVFT